MKVRVEDGYVKLTETSPHAVVQYMLSEYWSFGFPFPSLYWSERSACASAEVAIKLGIIFLSLFLSSRRLLKTIEGGVVGF